MSPVATADVVPAIELFDPMRPGVLKDPYAAYAALRNRCPVAYLEPLNMWVVSHYADVARVLSTQGSFSAALAFGKNTVLRDSRKPETPKLNLRFAGDSGAVVTASDGPTHIRLRRMLAGLMSKPRLDVAEREIQEHAHRVISALARERSTFDIVEDLAKPVAARAVGRIMGVDDHVTEVLRGWADLTFRSLDPHDQMSTAAARPHVMFSNLGSMRAVTAFLKASRDRVPEGLVEVWQQADTHALREEIVLSILHLFQAGYETMVSAICGTMAYAVIDQPESPIYSATPEIRTNIVDECLRLASPVRATFRSALGDQVISGVSVPDGAFMMVMIGSAHRDERVFDAPTEFRLGRETPHLAYGTGPHRCIGRVMAYLELNHLLEALLPAMGRIRTADGAVISANILKAGYDHLPVHVDWRQRLA